MTIREQLVKIQELAAALEDGSLPLEEALLRYEEGIRLIRECGAQIDQVEKRIQVLETAAEEKE